MLTATADTAWNLSLHNRILFLARVKADHMGHLSPSGICSLWRGLGCREEKDGRRHWLFFAFPPGAQGVSSLLLKLHRCQPVSPLCNVQECLRVSSLSTDTVCESRRRSIMKPPGTFQVVATGLGVVFTVGEAKKLKALFSLNTVFWNTSFSLSS